MQEKIKQYGFLARENKLWLVLQKKNIAFLQIHKSETWFSHNFWVMVPILLIAPTFSGIHRS